MGVPVFGLANTAAQYSAVSIVDKRCGTGTVAKWDNLRVKLFADQDAVDPESAIKDARKLIESADSCSPELPSCENSIGGTCDDRGFVFADVNLLLGEWFLAYGFGSADWDSPQHRQALGNYFSTAVELCKTPNVLKPAPPYDLVRIGLTMALEKAAMILAKFSDTPADMYRDGLRTCGQRIGDNDVTF